MKNKKLLISLLLFLIFVVRPINVFGYSYDPYDNYYYPDRITLVLPNGQYCIVTASTNGKIDIRIIDSNNDLVAQQEWTYKGSYSVTSVAYSVALYNDYVYILVAFVDRPDSNNWAGNLKIAKYNYKTNDISSIHYHDYGMSTSGHYVHVSKAFYYDNKLYWVVSHRCSSYRNVDLYEIESGVTRTELSTSIKIHTVIYGFLQDNILYIVYGDASDTNRPYFARIDLSTKTIETICSGLASGLFSTSANAFRYIGGAKTTSTEEYYIITHYWIKSDSDGSITVYRYDLKLNASNDELIEQSYDSGIFALPKEQTYPLVATYLSDEEVVFWALWQNSADDDYYIRKVVLDYNLTYQSGIEENALEGMLSDFNLGDVAYWYPTESYCYKIKYDKTLLRTYVVIAGIREWTISLSYSPSGDLYVNTQYLFTATIKMNDYVKSDVDVVVYFDNATLKSGKTDKNGELDFTVLTSTAGIHQITINIYYSNELEKTKTYNYMFYSTEATAETTLLPQTIQGIIGLLPIFFIVVVPMIMLFPLLKILSPIVWLPVSTYICTASGLLPLSIFFLALLVDAIIIVYLFKGGGK